MIKKLLYILPLVVATEGHAEEYGRKPVCKVKCKSAQKAVDKAMKAFHDFLDEVEKETGAYKKELDRLKGQRKKHQEKSSRALNHKLSRDPRTNLHNFATTMLGDRVKKNSNLSYCFTECGVLRDENKESHTFMYSYFVKALARLGTKNIKKLGLYSARPLSTERHYKLMDTAIQGLEEKEFNRILKEKAIDDEIRNQLQNIRDKKKSLYSKEFGAYVRATRAEMDAYVAHSKKRSEEIEKDYKDGKLDQKSYYKEDYRLNNPEMDPEILEKAYEEYWQNMQGYLKNKEAEKARAEKEKKLKGDLRSGKMDRKAYEEQMWRLSNPNGDIVSFGPTWDWVEKQLKDREKEYREKNKGMDPKQLDQEIQDKIWRADLY